MSARLLPLLARPQTLGACLVAFVALGCKATPSATPPSLSSAESPSTTAGSATAASVASAASVSPATPVPARACLARRAFVGSAAPPEDRRLTLPAPFQAFDACAALSAAFPDYDASTERSAAAGGIVRVRDAGLFLHAGHELLVLLDYRGKEAEDELVGGCDPFHAHVTLLTRSADGKALSVAARGAEPLTHAGVGSAISVGPSAAAAPSLALREDDSALVLLADHTCGTAPSRTAATVLVREGDVLREVLTAFVRARGMSKNDEIHEIAATMSTRPVRSAGKRAKDAFADVSLAWTDAACPFDEKGGPDQMGDYVCGRGKALGTDLYRYDGKRYVRRGAATKVPFL